MTKKVLVITDAQNEFITGALGNKECEAAVKYIVAAAESGEYYKVIFTKDTHTADYLHPGRKASARSARTGRHRRI